MCQCPYFMEYLAHADSVIHVALSCGWAGECFYKALKLIKSPQVQHSYPTVQSFQTPLFSGFLLSLPPPAPPSTLTSCFHGAVSVPFQSSSQQTSPLWSPYPLHLWLISDFDCRWVMFRSHFSISNWNWMRWTSVGQRLEGGGRGGRGGRGGGRGGMGWKSSCHLSNEPFQRSWRGRVGQRQLDVACQFGDESVGQPVPFVQRPAAETDPAEGARQRRPGAHHVHDVFPTATLHQFKKQNQIRYPSPLARSHPLNEIRLKLRLKSNRRHWISWIVRKIMKIFLWKKKLINKSNWIQIVSEVVLGGIEINLS